MRKIKTLSKTDKQAKVKTKVEISTYNFLQSSNEMSIHNKCMSERNKPCPEFTN